MPSTVTVFSTANHYKIGIRDVDIEMPKVKIGIAAEIEYASKTFLRLI
ncbi:MAG: hypothetical protein ACTS78_01170 [Arsenophonus sp. NC-WZS1-MAG3]